MASTAAIAFHERSNLAMGKTVRFRVFPQGTGAPVVRGGDGLVTVTRPGTGSFLCTMKHPYRWLMGAEFTVQTASSTDLSPRLGAVSNEGTTSPITVAFRLETGSTPTDMSANANNSVLVALTFEDSNTLIQS